MNGAMIVNDCGRENIIVARRIYFREVGPSRSFDRTVKKNKTVKGSGGVKYKK